jgi:predicted ester cyclase
VIYVGAAWRKGHPDMNMNIPAFASGPDRSIEGTWGADFYDVLKPAEDEIVIINRSVSALAGTELDRLLRVRDINTLLLAGVATNGVVEGTAREAVDLGYRAIVLEDCCASESQEMHDFSIRMLRYLCHISTVEEFTRVLDRPRAVGNELEKNKAVVRRFVDEVQTGHNVDVITELFAPDFVNRTRPTAPDRDGLKRVHSLLLSALPDASVTIHELVAEGDLVVARKTWRGTHRGELLGIPPTGKQVTLEIIDISRIRDGKIVEHWSEGGAEREMLEQLGVTPAPEPLRA